MRWNMGCCRERAMRYDPALRLLLTRCTRLDHVIKDARGASRIASAAVVRTRDSSHQTVDTPKMPLIFSVIATDGHITQ